MSEIRIYACDICGAQDAMHFVVPDVDFIPTGNQLGDGHTAHGNIDLCRDHIVVMLSSALRFMPNAMDKRRFWKDMLGK